MSGFAATRKAMLAAFAARWSELRPTWNHATQTAFPPVDYERTTDLWIKVQCTSQGGQNRAVGILDEVNGLMTVDCYARVDASDPDSIFAEDELADDAHNALRSMAYPYLVDDIDVQPRDFPVTEAGYQHKRVSLIFRFDLPRVTAA